MTKRHWNLRGMSLEQIMATSAAAFDDLFEEIIGNAENICRDHGGTQKEIESITRLAAKELEECRAEHLKELRSWLEHGGQTLQ
jgi:uncharacterized protein YggL (DUF469 family)